MKEVLVLFLENRIKHLNKIDAEFCADRWNPQTDPNIRMLAREESNKVTFARQELQEVLKFINQHK